MESLGLCFLTCSGSSFNCENVQSENLTWQQFLSDLALAVKSTSALQEQIFIVFSGTGTKRFFIIIIFLQEETLYRLCVMLSPSTQGQISSSLLTVPHSLYITQKNKSLPHSLTADTPRQQKRRTEADSMTFLPLQPHTVKPHILAMWSCSLKLLIIIA